MNFSEKNLIDVQIPASFSNERFRMESLITARWRKKKEVLSARATQISLKISTFQIITFRQHNAPELGGIDWKLAWMCWRSLLEHSVNSRLSERIGRQFDQERVKIIHAIRISLPYICSVCEDSKSGSQRLVLIQRKSKNQSLSAWLKLLPVVTEFYFAL